MAEVTGIAWCRSTFNPWIGCTKVGPGCDHCYAAESRPTKALGIQWGSGQQRHRTGIQNWNLPLRWDKMAAIERESGQVFVQSKGWPRPGFWPVFCASLGDVFDNEVPEVWRMDLLDLIGRTPRLTWLLLTKRIGLAARYLPRVPLPNVWLGATIVNAEEAARDVPKLLETPSAKRFVSYEPALGPVDWTAYPGLDWIIVGGESNQGQHKARPFDVGWARSTVQQCKAAGTPVFMKQAGSLAVDRNDAGFEGDGDDLWPAGTTDKLVWSPFGYTDEAQGSPVRIKLKDRAGADPEEWPEDLRVREFPR